MEINKSIKNKKEYKEQLHPKTEVLRFKGKLVHVQGRIQDFEIGGEFCNNVREIKYYFNI